MTTKELAAPIGKEGDFKPRDMGLYFRVMVVDTRLRFGVIDYRIQPIAGSGAHWVPSYRVTLVKP